MRPGYDILFDTPVDATRSPEARNQTITSSGQRRINTSRAQPDMKLAALLAVWQEKRKPSLKTLAAAEKAARDFTSYIGNIGIGEITVEDCFEFRDAVEQMPRSMPRAHRNLPFADAYALYGSRRNIARLSPASVKKYLGAVQALLSFAFQERLIPTNPGARIKVDGYKRSKTRRPFTKSELGQLFAAPLFTAPWSGRQSLSKVSDATLRWLFLLGLLTGARLEEMGQILLSDVKEELGMPYIVVTKYVAADTAGESKRVKTENSVRALPVHPQLIALGFLNYVERIRSEGAIRLFPDLKDDTLGVKTKEASRRAARLIDAMVGNDPRVVFHSFRHSFKIFAGMQTFLKMSTIS